MNQANRAPIQLDRAAGAVAAALAAHVSQHNFPPVAAAAATLASAAANPDVAVRQG